MHYTLLFEVFLSHLMQRCFSLQSYYKLLLDITKCLLPGVWEDYEQGPCLSYQTRYIPGQRSWFFLPEEVVHKQMDSAQESRDVGQAEVTGLQPYQVTSLVFTIFSLSVHRLCSHYPGQLSCSTLANLLWLCLKLFLRKSWPDSPGCKLCSRV